MKCTLWTETIKFWRLCLFHGLHFTGWPLTNSLCCALFLPLIHGLRAFFRPLSTPVSSAPSLSASQFTVCTSLFVRLLTTLGSVTSSCFLCLWLALFIGFPWFLLRRFMVGRDGLKGRATSPHLASPFSYMHRVALCALVVCGVVAVISFVLWSLFQSRSFLLVVLLGCLGINY